MECLEIGRLESRDAVRCDALEDGRDKLDAGRDAADDGGCIEWLEGGLFIEKADDGGGWRGTHASLLANARIRLTRTLADASTLAMASYAFRTAAGLASSLRVGLRSQLLRTRFSLQLETSFVPSRFASTSPPPARLHPADSFDEVQISEELVRASNGRASAPTPTTTTTTTQFPTEGLSYTGDGSTNDWSKSYFGLSVEPFTKEVADILQASLNPLDIEVKPGESLMHYFSTQPLIGHWI